MEPMSNMEFLSNIYSFWSYAKSKLEVLNPVDICNDMPKMRDLILEGKDYKNYYMSLTPSTMIYMTMQEMIEKIDPEIEFMINTELIKPINIPENSFVVKFNLEISASGNVDKFKTVQIVWLAAQEFKLTDTWSINKFCSGGSNANELVNISFKDSFISVGSIRYILRKVSDFPTYIQSAIINNKKSEIEMCDDVFKYDYNTDNMYDLMILIENDLGASMTEIDISILRNSVFVWLEKILGEFHTAINISRLTIIPEQGFDEICTGKDMRSKIKNGINLITDLQSIKCNNECHVCGITDIHTNITEIKDDFSSNLSELIPIGKYCDYCLSMTKRSHDISI